jgi:carbonic anhydrase
MRAWDEAVIPDGAMRSAVQQNLSALVRRGVGADSISAVTAAHVVETGLALLERSPIISRRVNQGRCGIICATTDSDDGRLRTYATIGPLGDVPDSMLELV